MNVNVVVKEKNMMNAKRITALTLALIMTLLLAACGGKTSVDSDSTKPGQTESDTKTDQPKFQRDYGRYHVLLGEPQQKL